MIPMPRRILRILSLAVALASIAAGRAYADDEFRPLFNGKDLSGWVPVNVAPETFTVRDGLIVSTGKPKGILRTERPYENFILELEYRHMVPQGNAGLFLWSDALPYVGKPFSRSIEVQILDGINNEVATSHGDVFAIQGATMRPDRPHPKGWMRSLPREHRAKPAPEWNHYRLTCRDGTVTLAVNGKDVSGGSDCVPRKGYLCLEAEGTECHFRNIRIQELPSSNPSADVTASLETGFVSLYSGLDLRGWKMEPGHAGHWSAKDYILAYDGASTAPKKDLWTEKDYGNFILVADWRLTNKPTPHARPVVLPSGDDATNPDGSRKTVDIPYAGDSGILLRGLGKTQVNITCSTIGSGEFYGYRTDKTMPPEVRSGAIPKVKADAPLGQWNRFIITLKGDRVTVVLNGKTVIEQEQLPGIPLRGPIGLQHHGDPLEFANLFIKELE